MRVCVCTHVRECIKMKMAKKIENGPALHLTFCEAVFFKV